MTDQGKKSNTIDVSWNDNYLNSSYLIYSSVFYVLWLVIFFLTQTKSSIHILISNKLLKQLPDPCVFSAHPIPDVLWTSSTAIILSLRPFLLPLQGVWPGQPCSPSCFSTVVLKVFTVDERGAGKRKCWLMNWPPSITSRFRPRQPTPPPRWDAGTCRPLSDSHLIRPELSDLQRSRRKESFSTQCHTDHRAQRKQSVRLHWLQRIVLAGLWFRCSNISIQRIPTRRNTEEKNVN